MGVGKPCPMREGAECWECLSAYREMIGRMATGSTIHSLNNQLLALCFACHAGNQRIYLRSLREFLDLCRVKIAALYAQ